MRKSYLPVLLSFLALTLPFSAILAAEPGPTDQELTAQALALEGDHWYGLYLGEQKVGWQRESWHSAPGEFCAETESFLLMAVQGSVTRVRSLISACYSSEAPFGLAKYESTTEEDDNLITVAMSKKGETLHFRVVANGTARETTAPAAGETLRSMLAWAHHARMQLGESLAVTSFDPVSDKVRTTRITLVQREERLLLGSVRPLLHMKVAEEGRVTLDGWISQEGRLLEGTVGSVFRIISEEEKSARTMGDKAADLHASTVIRATGKGLIGFLVHDVERLVVKLVGAQEFHLPKVPRQKETAAGDRWVTVEIQACPAPDLTEPLPEDIRCNTETPCDQVDVQKTAREAAGTETDPAKVVQNLATWIYKNFQYTQGGSTSTADRLLSRRTGDCSEFSKVMVLLSRALGIPAREVTGIVVADDQPVTFGYHAWVQVYLQGRGWVDVDPTWNHTPVDATHIALGVREDMSALVQLGKLEVEVLDATYATTPLTCPDGNAKSQDLPPH